MNKVHPPWRALGIGRCYGSSFSSVPKDKAHHRIVTDSRLVVDELSSCYLFFGLDRAMTNKKSTISKTKSKSRLQLGLVLLAWWSGTIALFYIPKDQPHPIGFANGTRVGRNLPFDLVWIDHQEPNTRSKTMTKYITLFVCCWRSVLRYACSLCSLFSEDQLYRFESSTVSGPVRVDDELFHHAFAFGFVSRPTQ